MAETVEITVNETTEDTTITVTDAQEIELQNNGTAIQWKREGETVWTDLVQVDSLKPSAIVFVSNEQKNVSNTAAEEDVNDGTDYQGSRTIAANSVLKGDVLEIESEGILSTSGTPTATIRVYWGTTLLFTSTETLPNNLAAAFFGLKVKVRVITTGATGAVLVYGRIILQSTSGLAAGVIRKMMSNTPVTVNTTTANDLKLTYQFSAASTSNSLRIDGSQITKRRVNV